MTLAIIVHGGAKTISDGKVEANNAYVGATTSLWMSFLGIGLSLTGLLIGILK